MEYERLKQDLRRAYDRSADDRNGKSDQPWKHRERARFASHLRNEGSTRLLEIGAGHGVGGRYFADQGLEVTCTDLSGDLVEHCRAKGLDAHVMSFDELRFAEATFDSVFGMNCLLHVPRAEIESVLASIRRVLAPGGLFYWGQFGGRDWEGVWTDDRYEPQRFFSFMLDEQIQRTAKAHFTVLDFRSIPNDYEQFPFQALVLRRL